MTKKGSSNIYRIMGKICLSLMMPGFVCVGCKEKEVVTPPPAVIVKPLPQRGVQANNSAAKKMPVQPSTETASTVGPPSPPVKKPESTTTVPAQASPAAAVKQTQTPPVTQSKGVQQQMSSPRLALAPKEVSLDFTSRRDPFKPYVQVALPQQANSSKNIKLLREALPIQSFEVEKFRLSGVVSGVKENSALVLDPNGKGYVVKTGMLIGNGGGRIKRITDSSLEVEEEYRDDNGKLRKRIVRLVLIRKK